MAHTLSAVVMIASIAGQALGTKLPYRRRATHGIKSSEPASLGAQARAA
jgi:hypothetical protein